MERRFTTAATAPVRIQSRISGSGDTISGYAACFYDGTSGTEYELCPGVVERINKRAFTRAITEAHDVRGLFNHDPDNLLGRTSSGTLRLSVDSRGLRYSISYDPLDPDHQRVARKLQRGDLTGSSFAFQATDEAWHHDGQREVREVLDAQLYDVGPVSMPAYGATSAGM
jgi:HK97 family phage prohead protease